VPGQTRWRQEVGASAPVMRSLLGCEAAALIWRYAGLHNYELARNR
jgi:hypothetical protein